MSLGIRNGDEVVVVVVSVAALGRVLTQVEMRRRERVAFFPMAMLLVAQAKYMVLRVSW